MGPRMGSLKSAWYGNMSNIRALMGTVMVVFLAFLDTNVDSA